MTVENCLEQNFFVVVMEIIDAINYLLKKFIIYHILQI